ncbi:Uncharacterised protein [Chryseobacterium taihuense]|jgi:hypothetical protein|uniref:Uncharacterized protein n=1 Tax=Chryseobacterium taihuense TaxID=1141221 RepID=A0A4V6IDV5_9FLAO|nr:Uncharacterised protein [Chryseobacterium taihuense]
MKAPRLIFYENESQKKTGTNSGCDYKRATKSASRLDPDLYH